MAGITRDIAIAVVETVLRDLRPSRWAACSAIPGLEVNPDLRIGYCTDDGFGVVTSSDAVFTAGFGVLSDLRPGLQLLQAMDGYNRSAVLGHLILVPSVEEVWSLMWSVKLPLEHFVADPFRYALGSTLYLYEDTRQQLLTFLGDQGGNLYWESRTLEYPAGLNVLSQLQHVA